MHIVLRTMAPSPIVSSIIWNHCLSLVHLTSWEGSRISGIAVAILSQTLWFIQGDGHRIDGST